MDVYSKSLKLHEKLKGKLEVKSKVSLSSSASLALAYTPGVAQPCREIFSNPEKVFDLTLKSNSLAVVTDGSSVLGLGNIGAEASIPVMEGKAVLFKAFAGIDAFPICIKSQETATIVETVKQISPVFGAINLEDISAPRCFEVEALLQEIGIPVMHDDQHGTAVVVMAALFNACRVAGKNLEDLNVVISGAGAAGTAITKWLKCIGVDHNICKSVKGILVADSHGIIYDGRPGLSGHKLELAKQTNRKRAKGTLSDALSGADVFVGVSKANLVSSEMVSSMAKNPVVLAMANPVPEIMPKEAKKGGALIVGTGRSDFPNQINNALAFPGIFRGALDAKATVINNEMKIAAAHALAGSLKKPSAKSILPKIIDKKVHYVIARAVEKAARESGVSRN